MAERVLKQDQRVGLRLVASDEGARIVYRVVLGDSEVLYKTKVEASARIEYDDHREALWAQRPELSPQELLRREAAHYEMQAVRSEAFDRRAKQSRPKGGRGGRGGI